MRIRFNYFAQIRQAAGVDSLLLDLDEGTTLSHALAKAADQHGEAFRSLILAAPNQVRPSIILLLNDTAVRDDLTRKLKAGDSLSLLSPLSGG